MYPFAFMLVVFVFLPTPSSAFLAINDVPRGVSSPMLPRLPRTHPGCRRRIPSFEPLHLAMANTTAAAEADAVDEKDSKEIKSPAKIAEDIFDPIISSPLFATFLFWAPFVSNPSLRSRASEFVSSLGPLRSVTTLSAIVIVAGTRIAYQSREGAVEEAASRREIALRNLRDARRAQFSPLPGGGADTSAAAADNVSTSASGYEEALREELRLRLLLPGLGLRMPVPDDPVGMEEDQAAARQFLGLEITEDGELTQLDAKG